MLYGILDWIDCSIDIDNPITPSNLLFFDSKDVVKAYKYMLSKDIVYGGV